MSKPKSPLLSLGARGTIGDALTFQKRNRGTFVREKPIPAYRYTLPQAYQRWLYEDYAYLWRQQSAATRQEHATAGSRFHLTGFQYWMKYHLTNLPDIVSWWRLDEKAGAVAYDSSKKGHHGTIIGASPTDGIIDGAYYFDGLNDLIAIPPNSLGVRNNFTILIAFNPSLDAGRQCLLRASGELNFCISLNVHAPNIIEPYAVIGGIVHSPFCATPYTSAEDWIEFALTKSDITGVRQFKNGVFHCADATATGDIDTTFTVSRLGAYSPGTFDYKGSIDKVMFLNRVLDDTEILRHSLRRYPA